MSSDFVHQGESCNFRHRRHGAPSLDLAPESFVIFAQNHDQIGNRPKGDRLVTTVSSEQAKLVAAEAVRAGRAAKFASLAAQGQLFDPAAESTSATTRIDRSLCHEGEHLALFEVYRDSLRCARRTRRWRTQREGTPKLRPKRAWSLWSVLVPRTQS